MAAAITAALVKELRERTGLGMMECKKALQEADGDIELAIENLRKSAGLKSAKKAGRIAAEGVIVTQVDEKGSIGAMLEVNSETDFVARDENFLQFSARVIQAVFEAKSDDIEALMADELETARQELVQKIGENISVRRAAILEAPKDGVVGAYVHGNRIGVMVAMRGANAEVARNIAMHVAALNPTVALAEHMPESVLEHEKSIILAQPDLASKPPEIAEKMVQGRLKKFIAENTLVEQAFVKEPNISVGEYAKQAKGEVLAFVRFEVGEGIEKEKVDFAKEVMAQAQRH